MNGTYTLNCQRNDFYSTNESLLRNRLITTQQSKPESFGKNSEQSFVTQSNRSLSSETIRRIPNKYPKREQQPSVSLNLTQNFVFALFLLLLFCFVIFLSLPVVLKTSCDFQSMNFQFTIERLPQNNNCIKL